MNKREIVLLMIIMAMFVLVMLYMVKTKSIERRLAELEFEQQRSCNVSVSVTCVPTLPPMTNTINLTSTDLRQDHLQANYQQELSIDSEHIAFPQICVSQWLDNAITLRDTLNCIEGNIMNEQLQVQGSGP